MTYEEAIKKIDFLIGGYQMLIDENIGNGDVVGHGVRGTWQSETSCIDAYKDLINACKTAKQAIEKQIPKKPTPIYDGDKCFIGRCECGRYVPKSQYCSNCGQRLDWSE